MAKRKRALKWQRDPEGMRLRILEAARTARKRHALRFVEVEVDTETGWLHVDKIWIAHDIGRALNPTLARGQVEGSVYMGLGEALMEEQAFRRLPPKLSSALVHRTPSILEYKSITSLEMPDEIGRAHV